MPFFPKDQDPVEVKYAKALHNALAQAGLITTKPAIKRGAEAFRLLHSRDLAEHITIAKTLAWYIKNIKEPYVPICHSAKTFRSKFIAIRKAMERSIKDIPISADAKLVIKHTAFIWPGPEKEQEAAFVQKSLDNYQEFLKGLKLLTTTGKKRGFAEYLLKNASDPVTFVMGWLTEVHKMACTWEPWKRQGHFMFWVFDIDKNSFRVQMEERALEWCGRSNEWQEIVKLLKDKS